MTIEFWIFVGAWFASIGFLIGTSHLRNWRIASRKLRVPVAEKLLRSPGEGLSKKLEELDDQVSQEVAVGLILPLLYVGSILLQARKLPLGPWLIGAYTLAGIGGLVALSRRLGRLVEKGRAYRLGLSGERAVGEELNQSMLTGCRVFHDVPNDPYGNIDHVLIAASGVYAVETKTRRKKEALGKTAYKVTFDGHSLRFAGGAPESQCLQQARQQANRLSDKLSKATGEPVAVHPVVALPGWYVDRQGRGDVIVISARKAGKKLAAGRAVLDKGTMGRIAHQLDQLCRNVEF
jgi:hypothetical protein